MLGEVLAVLALPQRWLRARVALMLFSAMCWDDLLIGFLGPSPSQFVRSLAMNQFPELKLLTS